MKQCMEQRKMIAGPARSGLALLLVCALILSMLPMQMVPVRAVGRETKTESDAKDEMPTLKNPTTDADGITTWDTVYFGSYWQNDTNGDGKADQNDEKEPIRWRVLSVDGDDAFLLADENLDCRKYNDNDTYVTWETCTLRSWLNDTFLNSAFTAAEQSAIRETSVENPDNPEYGTEGGNDTTDWVYLLSIDEATNPAYGFSSDYGVQDKSRWAKNTEYAKEQGVYTSTDGEYAGNGYWWLRSPGNSSANASYVTYDGIVTRCGNGVGDDSIGRAARAALHLNLSSDSEWSYGGTVRSDSTIEQKPGSSPSVKPTEMPTLKKPTTDADGITTWDTVYFGSYWQNDTNGDGKADQNDEKEPIRWRVLSVDGDDAFLLADENLDCRMYNDTYTDVTWETCTLRSWLNDTFLNNAFTAAEQSAIRETSVKNPDNPEYGTEGGNDTTDRVYLLSIDEATNPAYGFSSNYSVQDKSRWAKNTEYAKEQGAYTSTDGEYAGNGYWWLRSPGNFSNDASYVYCYGHVDQNGDPVDIDIRAARTALHLNLSSDSEWSYGGTVRSDSTVEQKPSSSPCIKPTERPTLKNPTTDADGITTWDTVYFGSYWQNDTNGDGKADQNDEKEPIRWRVLSVDGDDAFLLADENLDCRMYNDTYTDVTWETCTLRSWLNDTFLNNAFTAAEQSVIRETPVENPDNPEYGTEGGNDTTDRVYLLSIDEATNPAYGFSSDYSVQDKSRWAKNTEYAKEQGAYTSTDGEYAGNGYWWLRSPGDISYNASDVSNIGSVIRYGNYVDSYAKAARAALHLNLSSDLEWSYGGTVRSDSTVEQKPGSSPSVKPTERPTLKNPTTDADGITTWDTVYFGSYWQNDTNGDGKADQNDEKEPIRWRVLSVDGDDAFLLADENLDRRKYNDTYTDFTWETCTLRSWLNNTFLNHAFSETEQRAIRESLVENPDNLLDDTEGNSTTDKVYLLSLEEVANPEYGILFDNDTKVNRRACAKNTEYTKAQGAYTEDVDEEYEGNGDWWLRSPGLDGGNAAYVNYFGYVCRSGRYVAYSDNAVRPVLHLSLADSGSVWSYGGIVNSEGDNGSGQDPNITSTPEPTLFPTLRPTYNPAEPTKYPPYSPKPDADGVMTWDCIYFGSYWQNDTNGDGVADQTDEKEPIVWRVLSDEGDNEYILMSEQALDSQPYNESYRKTTWAECSLRKWLNRDFFQEAFSASDQKAIRKSIIDDVWGSSWTAYNSTIDRIYLPSYGEVTNMRYGFYESAYKSGTRKVFGTAYARARGVYSDMSPEGGGNVWWWLRTQRGNIDYAASVGPDGTIDTEGYEVCRMQVAVRPVLRVNLSMANWKNAGQINVNGKWKPFFTARPTASPTIEPTEKPVSPPDGEPSPTIEPTEKPASPPGGEPSPTIEPTEKPASPPTERPPETAGPQEKPPQSTDTAAPSPIQTAKHSEQPEETGEADDDEYVGPDDKGNGDQLKKGSIVTAGGIRYKIMSTKKNDRTVMLWSVINKRLKNVTIPGLVKLRSHSFQVVQIAGCAFEHCKNLKKVTIGKNVEIIGKKAFRGCKKLRQVIIHSKKLKKIEKNAFSGIGKNIKFKIPEGVSKGYRKMIKKAQK